MGKEKCAVTWEPAENVPAAVIQEFEQGDVAVALDSATEVGICQTVHTLIVSHTNTTPQAPPHHASSTSTARRPVVTHNEGYIHVRTSECTI